ncbi:conserved hypothetical protein [Perkinsus marinus ATCC 50983]|uniref:Phospholipid/glycerol acyltransferase domain-containing protein n=1 Tax=Perkinsus marinus (strain ATCC 50983 / TXsc) TaxID=423536 RepID=C5K583_PERM5|nr:conserved hypothetical protein [Perkinsus marinus ATCC 50983]EER20505.1 conserved hypothetical protein [Perkinsus marinus ATCC 50983]|eukprot:XP_002788709.1 conserved hypothetical protein [Perkinsus marinus ATCC 50983]
MSWPTILFLAVYLLTTALCVYAVARGYADAEKCSTERINRSFGEVPSDWKAFIRPKSLRSNFVSIMILAVTVVPLKFIAVIFIHVVALIGLYTLPTRIFLKLLSYCCAALVKITGITVREEGTRLPANEVPTIVSNHVSYFDILIMLSRRVPVAFVAKKAVAKYPVSGDICTSLGSVYVSRAKDPKERERVMAAIGDKQKRVMEGRSRYQLCVFPEGTTSNGGRSRELWIAAIKPEEEAAHNVLIPKEPIRVGAKTQPSSLAGFVSHRLKEEGVALLQGSSAVTIAKMADAIALAGAHFDGEEGRSLGHLVCRLRTIVVEADATATPEKEVVDHTSEDGSDHGETTSSRRNRIRVMQILVRLKEGPVGGCQPAAAHTGGGSEEEGAEVTIDSIDKPEGDDDTVTRSAH